MKPKIRVLEIINNAEIGGGPGHIVQILRRIDPYQFETSIACTPVGGDLSRLREFSTAYFPVPISKKFRLKTVLQLRQIMRREQIQIVHTHGGVAGLWGRLATWGLKNVAVVHTLHGIHFLNYRNPVLKHVYILIERVLSRLTDKIICVAQADFDKAIKYRLFPAENGNVIRNGIDFSTPRQTSAEILALKKSLGLDPDSRVIGQVARLHVQKGQKYLLEAFRLVRQKHPEAQLLIIGDGPAKAELVELTAKLNISQFVHFPGFRTDVSHLLQLMDVFVLSSLWEGLPLALLEALNQSIPVVATAVNGIPETISPETDGILVPPADAPDLAQGILRILETPELAARFRKAGPEKIQLQFCEQNMVYALENIYLNLVENKK